LQLNSLKNDKYIRASRCLGEHRFTISSLLTRITFESKDPMKEGLVSLKLCFALVLPLSLHVSVMLKFDFLGQEEDGSCCREAGGGPASGQAEEGVNLSEELNSNAEDGPGYSNLEVRASLSIAGARRGFD
jgi:hypothetical protein